MRFGIVLALLVLVAGLFLFGLRRDPSLLPSVLAEKRKPAPDFTLPILPPTAKLGEKRSGFPGSSAGLSSLTSGPAGAPPAAGRLRCWKPIGDGTRTRCSSLA